MPSLVIANQKWKIYEKEGVIVSQLNGQALAVQQLEIVGSRRAQFKNCDDEGKGTAGGWVITAVGV